MYISDNDRLFYSRLDDAVNLCYTRQKPYFFSFLSERKQAIAEKYLKSICFENYLFYGGFEGCKRKVLGLFHESTDKSVFPVSAIVFRFSKFEALTHRDFLGALMSLGIERETVGDILIEDGRCVVFIKSELKDFVESQISKIGRTGVKIAEFSPSDLPKGRGYEENHYTVSSLRLDNIVAAVTGLSREKTKNLILSGNVSADFVSAQNISMILNENTVFTIKGKGKYILNSVLGETRKGRIRISVIHFR